MEQSTQILQMSMLHLTVLFVSHLPISALLDVAMQNSCVVKVFFIISTSFVFLFSQYNLIPTPHFFIPVLVLDITKLVHIHQLLSVVCT